MKNVHLRLIGGTQVPPISNTPPAGEEACNDGEARLLHLGGLARRVPVSNGGVLVQPFRDTKQGGEIDVSRSGRRFGKRLLRHPETERDASQRNTAGANALGDDRGTDGRFHAALISQNSELRNASQKLVIARTERPAHHSVMEGDELRQRLREVMAKLNIKSGYDWAARIGNAKSTTIAEFLNGNNATLNTRTLNKMAKAVDMTVAELLGQGAPSEPERQHLEMIKAIRQLQNEMEKLRNENSAALKEILEALRALSSSRTDDNNKMANRRAS